MQQLHRVIKLSVAGLLCLCTGPPFIGVSLAAAQNSVPSPDQHKFTPPPGEETPEVMALINRAKTALASGKTAADVLKDSVYVPVHEWPRFRKLIREHASTARTTLVTAKEPGKPMFVSGTVRDRGGRPVKGALVYVYHTSAKGWYSDRAAHISGNAGDEKHARLFGYLKTDAEGKYEFRTIRPAGYPETDLPAHIHVEIEAPGEKTAGLVTEIRFDDDPRMTEAMRRRSRQEGFLICTVTRGPKDEQRVTADFEVRASQ